MKSRIQYLKDSHGQLVGCLAIVVDRHSKKILHQVSVCNPVDEFDSKEARLLALTRLIEEPVKLPMPRRNCNMNTITATVMKSLAQSKSAPSRATKAAKLWLKKVEAKESKTKTK